jgi:hypothetical protein
MEIPLVDVVHSVEVRVPLRQNGGVVCSVELQIFDEHSTGLELPRHTPIVVIVVEAVARSAL